MGIFDGLIIFEMANSHQGDVNHGINIIKEIAKITREYNIKGAIKFQYRNLDSFIHPSYKGRKDIKHIPRFESTRLNFEDFSKMVEYAKNEGLIPMSTPFDEDGVDWCLDQGLEIIKVASSSSMDWPLLEKIAKSNKPIIVSTGGKTISDIDKIYNFLIHRNCDFAFLHCVSEYPVPQERIQLNFIDKMKKRYNGIIIGYSGHEDPNDHIVPMLAIAKGAEILERHVGLPTDTITLNSYSMNPEQTRSWVKSIVVARDICSLKKEDTKYISQSELESLESLSRGAYAKKNITLGDTIELDDVFFAMPYLKGQMKSSDYFRGVVASRDYDAMDPILEERKQTDISIARSVVHEAKGLLFEAGISLGDDFSVELSHHYGMKHFRQFGAVIVNVINREYCKKLIIVLPGQSHPNHFHKLKEETFQLLFGDLTLVLDETTRVMKPGDIQTVLRGQQHSFSSRKGGIFEEISTTHIKGDSYYLDSKISELDLIQRKSIIENW